MGIRISLFLCALSVLSGALPGRADELDNIRFSHLTVNDGLVHSNVNCIVQDDKGYVWLATRGGLCRYDGYEVVRFLHAESDPKSLIHNYVTWLMIDHRQRLWVCTEGGVCRYDAERDEFHRYQVPGQVGCSIACLSDGSIVASFGRALHRYREADDSFAVLEQHGGGDFASIYPYVQIVEGRDGILWMATNGGLVTMDYPARRIVNILPEGEDRDYLQRSHVLALCTDESGKIYIGSHHRGLYIYDPDEGSLRNIDKSKGLGSNVVRAVMMDRGGNLWIGGEYGVDIIREGSSEVLSLRHDPDDRSNINDNAVYSLFEDRSGNYWVGTYFGGVNLCLKHSRNFTCYRYGHSDRHLSGRAVRQIIGDGPQTLWIATEDGGLNRFDRATRTFRHHTAAKGDLRPSYHNIHALMKDRTGDLWIGSFTGGVNRYDFATGRMTRYTNANTGAAIDMTFNILEDLDGDRVWIGGTNGLTLYRRSENRFVTVFDPLLNDRFVYYMMQDSRGIIWACMRRYGMVVYDPRTDKAHRFETAPGFGQFITSVFEDSRGNIWVGSNDGGLLLHNRQTDDSVYFTTENGLTSNSVMAVIEDHAGMIWITTTAGLNRFDPYTRDFTRYTVDDGLPVNQFNYASAYLADDGELFFGTIDGMISFYPDRLMPDQGSGRVILTALSILGKPVRIGEKLSGTVPLPRHIAECDRITLTHKQAGMFSFDFTSEIDFKGTDIHYYISVDNSEWQPVGAQRKITFTNLSWGTHTIRFSTLGQEPPTSIKVNVLPPFWMSWRAVAIYIVILAGILAVIYRFIRIKLRYDNSIRQERLDKENVKEVNNQKIRFLTNISHELKTPLTLILSPLDTMRADPALPDSFRQRIEVVGRNARRMLTMVDEQLSFSKIEMGRASITVQSGIALPFIDEQCQLFRMVAAERGLNLVTEIDTGDTSRVWFSPQIVEKVIYNLVSNAIKFTPSGGTIVVAARIERKPNGETMLVIVVDDTGIGIPEGALLKVFDQYYQINPLSKNGGYGIGLAYTKSLVMLHKGHIGVRSEEGKGAVFTAELNVSEEAYSPSERSPVALEDDYRTDYTSTMLPEQTEWIAENEPAGHDPEDGSRRRILVVEDNEELNRFICGLFGDQYTVYAAFDGRFGYELAVKNNPDLVISDVMMPDMDGYELTAKLKSEFMTSHIPVILITARTASEDRIKGFEYGADVYIKKPFDAQRLILQAGNLIRTRQNNILRFKDSPLAEASAVTHNKRDEKFIEDIVAFIRENIDNESLSIDDMTSHMKLSRSMLYLKLRNLVDMSATELLRKIRMMEAKKKLSEGFNVSETAYAVGISDPNYFSKCFKRQFGITPSEFVKHQTHSPVVKMEE